MPELNCQDFKEGCCGCCVNMRWKRARLERFLAGNTAAVDGCLERNGGKLALRNLIAIHLRRGGMSDYLLALILVPFTLGLSAFIWKRVFGSCCFAGYIEEGKRVGCLIHPLRLKGGDDLRKHAFPLVPTLNCDRDLICPQLRQPHLPPDADWYQASVAGARSLRQ